MYVRFQYLYKFSVGSEDVRTNFQYLYKFLVKFVLLNL